MFYGRGLGGGGGCGFTVYQVGSESVLSLTGCVPRYHGNRGTRITSRIVECIATGSPRIGEPNES